MSNSNNAVDASDPVLEGASEVAEGVVDMARGFTPLALGAAFVAGAALGGAVGFYFGKRMMQTKYSCLAAEEIVTMREHYNQKLVALEGSATKPELDALVRDQGYSAESDEVDEEPVSAAPPMAVTPPAAVVEAAEEGQPPAKTTPRVEMDGEPVEEESESVRNIFQEYAPPPDTWDYAKERARRSPLRPYIIHIDEREEQQAYDAVTFTYYEEDDVLCNERDEVISQEDRERIIGEPNLSRFGHGSNDASVVYIRNDQLEMDVEVVRSPNSYAEEVHGFGPEIRHSDRHRKRAPFDDE